MKIKFRYDNEMQIIEIETDEAAQWVNLTFEDIDSTEEEKERMIQQKVEEEWNRPEYNSWHKFDRHRGRSKACPGSGDTDDCFDPYDSEPLMEEVRDDRVFRKYEIDYEKKQSYEEICKWIRSVLSKKPNWAEAFIAVRMNDVPVNEYAASLGLKDASIVSKWLSRATKKLRENFNSRQI